MPALSPALGASSSIAVPTSTTSTSARAALVFTAQPATDEAPDPVYELWTELPESDSHTGGGSWRAVRFDIAHSTSTTGSTPSYQLRLAATLEPGRQYEYTLRRLWPDGGLEWFGNGGDNGVVHITEGPAFQAEGIEAELASVAVKGRAESPPPTGDGPRQTSGPLVDLGPEVDDTHTPPATEKHEEPRAAASVLPAEAEADAQPAPEDPFLDPPTPTRAPSPAPQSASDAAVAPRTPSPPPQQQEQEQEQESEPEPEHQTQPPAHFFALLGAFFARLFAFLCHPLSRGGIALGSEAGDVDDDAQHVGHAQHAGQDEDDRGSETTDDAPLKTPGDSPLASSHQTPQAKSAGLLVDVESPTSAS